MSEGPKQILDKIEKLTDEPSKEQTTELPKPVSSLTNSSGLMAKAWFKQYFDDTNFPEWTKGSRGITVPLSFPEKEPSPILDDERLIVCLLCEENFNYPHQKSELISHLLLEHGFVIDKPELVADFPSYIAYWRNKFAKANVVITDYTSVLKMPPQAGGEESDSSRDIYVLSDRLTEDKELRMHLQWKRLENVLQVQEKERNNNSFKRSCFFCRTVFEGSSAKLLNHMCYDHNFSVGQPHNLVFIEELLDILENKLDSLVCIFCEKVFKTRDVLKEHMRKKNHKKINPRNADYDKYYLINYLEMGKSWEQMTNDRDYEDKPFEEEDLPTGFDSDHSDDDEEDNNWSDWRGNLSGAVCFFCPANYTDLKDLLNHMQVIHEFDYEEMKHELQLSFYQQIKLINFIRRQMHLNQCINCSEKFCDSESLMAHMKTESHLKPPNEKEDWDQSQYYFPTYENDNFLCLIEDDDDGGPNSKHNKEEDAPVIPQEMPVKDSILFQEEYRKQLLPRK